MTSLIWNESDIQVFQFSLNAPDDELNRLASLLTPNEFAQAHAFAKPELRRSAIIRRAHLRELLAAELNIQPTEIEFQSKPLGKPQAANQPIHFSASSSGSYGLVAISRTKILGVDIERHDPTQIHDATQDDQDPTHAFFQAWTQKEAIFKVGLESPNIQTRILPVPEGYSGAVCWLSQPTT